MLSSLEDLKTHIENAINNAENNISKITDNIIKMEGMTGTKTRHFYNNLLNMNDARYLEIGTWKGSSVCSAMCDNSASVICIDNWSEFGGPKNEFLINFNIYKGKNNASFIEADCYNIDVKTLPKFNIYMYDGNHTENSHHRALTHFIDCLDDTFIFIVDDWNWHGVRKGTIDAIKSLNLNIIYSKEIFTDDIVNGVKETWWNGIYIAILQKSSVNNISKSIDYKIIDCDYTFYEGLDSGGNDIKCVGKIPLDKLIQAANSNWDCVAFNTLGYLKSSITLPLIKSQYLNSPHGIFIKNIPPSTPRINSYYINYNSCSTPLCNIALKYDTDKCAIRKNATGARHSHPYSIFYNNIFECAKDIPLRYCEIGILYGESLCTFADFFTNADITGFEYSKEYIDNFNLKNTNRRIKTDFINIRDKDSIISSLNKHEKFDIIIEDSTHEFDDQIRFIKCATDRLNDGGIMIIEDIFKKENESKYYNELTSILNNYQEVYFITLDHINRNSHGWDNDKLLVLKKKGKSIFDYKPKITIITPSCRPSNIPTIKKSILFENIDKWIIVYDANKVKETKQYNNIQIEEYTISGPGISGNPQRNYALDTIKNYDGFIYFLDDDNIIHPNFWNISKFFNKGFFYSFNQQRTSDSILKGNKCVIAGIDTAMYITEMSPLRWDINKYEADGIFIQEIKNNLPNNHIYIDMIASYYNYISK